MRPALDPRKAEAVTGIVGALGDAGSFRNIMREAACAGVLKRHETLRRYLDLLVMSKVLRVRTRDVGSVNLQQLYTVASKIPEVRVGLVTLRRQGLNWEIPGTEMRKVQTDFEGLARAKVIDRVLIASLEDCLIQELYRDAKRETSAISFVVAMISTRTLDLAYLLRRADQARVGKAVRLMFNRILEMVSSKETEVAASVFMAVRARFLKIARQYSHAGYWKLVDEEGVGDLGLQIVRDLTEHDIIMVAGKQLGVTG